MCFKRIVLLIVLCFGLESVALAAEFLGEEGGDETVEDEPAPKPKAKKRRAPAADESDDGGGGGGGDISVSGGLGAGSGYISGQVTVGYGFNRYVGIDTTISYYAFDTESASGVQYGPEVDLVLRLANPTIVTPFVGAGPGYEKWSRTYEGEIFDDRGALTGNAFGGVSIMLTSHFGIQVVRKQVTYLIDDPPISFSDRVTHEPKSTVETTAGFHVRF
jgi:hypothetical protein